MPAYTAILFTDPDDGSWAVRVPCLPAVKAQGATRADALANAKEAIVAALADLAAKGQPAPREEHSPVRTVWVRNPRRGDTVPYVVAIERADEGVTATPVVFPELHLTAATEDEALDLIGPYIHEHLVRLVAEKRYFPTQDDPQSYLVRVPAAPPAA